MGLVAIGRVPLVDLGDAVRPSEKTSARASLPGHPRGDKNRQPP